MKYPRTLTLALAISVPAFTYAGDYVVGVENIDYYPHYKVNVQGEYEGFGRDLLDSFAEASGHTFEYKPLPVARLMGTFLAGDVDFKYPDNENWSGDARVGHDIRYSNPIVDFIDGVAAPEKIEKLESISTVLGFTPWAYYDQIQSGAITVHKQDDISKLIRFVMAGRAQGAYFNIDVLKYHLRESGQEGAMTFQEHLPYSADYYHFSTISHPDVMDEFNTWLANNPKRVQELKTKYRLSD